MDHKKWNVSREKDFGWCAFEPSNGGAIPAFWNFPRWREAYAYARRRAQLEQS